MLLYIKQEDMGLLEKEIKEGNVDVIYTWKSDGSFQFEAATFEQRLPNFEHWAAPGTLQIITV